MDARAWRIAGGSAAALLGLLALVLWRTDDLAGGWLWALRLTALLASAGLLTATFLAARAALAPPVRREVVVRVPTGGSPQTEVRSSPDGLRLLRSALLLAVVSAAPVLAVLVLASPAPDPALVAGGAPPVSTPSASQPAPSASASAGGDAASPDGAVGSVAPEPPATTPSATGPPPTGPPATGPPATGPPAEAAAPAPASCERTVATGDSLWQIAAEQLGPTATVAEVAERTAAVYADNAEAIGADPDLIRPGQVLRSCG